MADLHNKIYSSIKTINKTSWNQFILRSPFASLYFRYEFLQAIEEGTDYQPRHIVVTKNDNILGIFPNFIQPIPHLPFKLLCSTTPGYGGPLINTHEHQILPLMMKALKQICTKTILAHYIHSYNPGFIRYHLFLINQGYHLNLCYTRAVIPLQHRTYTEIRKQYARAKRRILNKMEKKNIQLIDQPITKETLTSFHQGYVKTMQRVGGMPVPLKLLFKFQEYLPDRLKLASVTVNNETIGQQLHFIDKEQQTVTAWIINNQAEHFHYHPSTLLNDYMIRWALTQHYTTFDMGYSLADYHDGLFIYKEEFGARKIPILHWEKSYSPISLSLIKKGGTLYKKMVKNQSKQ